jgi:rhodanese-related sulfurtransferase
MNSISAKEAKELIAKGEAQVLDVRTPSEFSGGHIPGAINIDIGSPTFEVAIKKLDMSKPYVVNCQSGGRSSRACSIMQNLGFKSAMNLDGGITSWKSEGFPVEKQ